MYSYERDMTGVATEWLVGKEWIVLWEIAIPWGRIDLVGFRAKRESVIERCMQRIYQPLRGVASLAHDWLPMHEAFISVELKLTDVNGARRQAEANLRLADYSYVGFPKETAERVVRYSNALQEFNASGIGVLSISPGAVEEIHPARRSQDKLRYAGIGCAERFWADCRTEIVEMADVPTEYRPKPRRPRNRL